MKRHTITTSRLTSKLFQRPCILYYRPSSKRMVAVLATILATTLAPFLGSAAHAQPLQSARLVEHLHQKMIYRAMDLAKEAYRQPSPNLAAELQALGYHEYRNIRFLADRALWKDQSPFEVQLLHPGFLYQYPVNIYQVIDETMISVPFAKDFFRYDGDSHNIRELTQDDASFSGFRVHYPLNNPDYKDELIVFQGASYFRPLGPGVSYGASARGLAIDTAEPSGEEFPHFSEFWLVKPTSQASTLTLYALLDSPSITGAYRFELQPGLPSKIDVSVDLFPRKTINKLGIAPLTSMFFHGENSVRPIDDFRPEIHDSDGLLIASKNQQWIWRPTTNPKHLRISTFSGEQLAGFGLMQRDRDFYHYQDTEARYDRRPSLWIEPKGLHWGKGHVELVEIPTQNETNDNTVAYWVPQKQLSAGQQLTLNYSLHITDNPQPAGLGKVVQTRNGWGAVPGEVNPPPQRKRQLIVDFSGWPENTINPALPIEAQFEHSSGTVTDFTVYPLPDNKTWRVSFKLEPTGGQAVDMSLSLMLGKRAISETWNYVWYPEEIE